MLEICSFISWHTVDHSQQEKTTAPLHEDMLVHSAWEDLECYGTHLANVAQPADFTGIGTICFALMLVPQVLLNTRRRSTEGFWVQKLGMKHLQDELDSH